MIKNTKNQSEYLLLSPFLCIGDEVNTLLGKLKSEEEKKMIGEMFRMCCDADYEDLSLQIFNKAGATAWEDKGPFPTYVLETLRKAGELSKAEQKLKEGKDNAIKELKAMFNNFDKNQDGTLDINELEAFAASMRAPLDKKELEAALEAMDTNKDGSVSFDELYSWWSNAERTTKSTG